MSKVLITRSKLDDLATTVSAKSGVALPLTIAQMQTAVQNIPTGGGTLIEKSITANGTYDAEDDSADGYSSVTVAVPTPTPRSSSDLTASGATVTAPAGYYESSASKSVASGTAGTPTATKGTVSNHSISVTPSVTNTTGYITGGTKTGTAVTVSASELVSGNLDISQSGTTDVTNYATVNVPVASFFTGTEDEFYTDGSTRKWHYRGMTDLDVPEGDTEGWIGHGRQYGNYVERNAVPANTTITPTTSAQTIGGANYMMEGAVTVTAMPSGTAGTPTLTKGTVDKPDGSVWITPSVTNTTGYITGGTKTGTAVAVTAKELVEGNTITIDESGDWDVTVVETATIPAGTAGTPTASKGTVSNHSVSVTPSVTNTTGYITGGTKTGTAVTVSASELVSGTLSITSSGTKDVTNYASASVAAGTAGTPTATKGTVSNHSVSVTPSVTNTAGYITGGTQTGTAVTVSASELASGNKTITQNGTNIDVVGYSTVSVDVQSGGGTPMQIEYNISASGYTSSTLTFTNLKGDPTSFWLMYDNTINTGTPSKVAALVYDGTTIHGQIVTNTSNAQASYNTAFSKSYSSGTLTITSTGASFTGSEYYLTYTYGGGTIDTKDVQVGSGATSITFTGLDDEPIGWSCIFKSNFGTSSGYQRVMYVEHEGTYTGGISMDSSAQSRAAWSYTYNNGSLTITSQGTNNGGYFHQPGYYQLTYVSAGSGSLNLQAKNYSVSSAGTETITADSDYDGLSRVVVSVPSGTAGTPTATKGTVSNHSVSVTPSVTNTTGYITGSTKTGTAVTVSASELVSGSETKTANGTYDVTNIASLVVAVPIVTYYVSQNAPSSSTGSNGDIYLQTT